MKENSDKKTNIQNSDNLETPPANPISKNAKILSKINLNEGRDAQDKPPVMKVNTNDMSNQKTDSALERIAEFRAHCLKNINDAEELEEKIKRIDFTIDSRKRLALEYENMSVALDALKVNLAVMIDCQYNQNTNRYELRPL